MSPIHAITPIPLPLSTVASDALAALRDLEKRYQPHSCGGFRFAGFDDEAANPTCYKTVA